ncbi:MAG TPA: hypothetical protein VIT66_11360 [Lysobacter sp.]
MNHPRHEPLTPEERALAQRLARIGPHDDGPPPSLDAKILAAAHAAVAPTSRRRRWLALTSVPASLITGAGMAAALALVVGVVWQLRPASGPARAPRGEADDMGYISAEIIKRERPPAPPAPPPPPPAPAEPPAAPLAHRAPPAPAKALSAPPVQVRQQAAAPAARNDVAPEQVAHAAAEPNLDEANLDEAVVDAPAPAAPAGYVRARASRAASAPPAATVMASPAAADSGFVPAPPTSTPPAPSAQIAPRKAVAAESEAKARAEADSMQERAAAKQSQELDRIEVSGTRITLADVPVREDARLPIEGWLQRIRERRDGGDLDGARSSLMLFRREHPHHRVPDDLRALPAPEPGR